MAWYGRSDWDFYPPYVSVGEKKARSRLALTKLLKRSKRTAEPVVAPRTRQVAATFWGKAWCDNLERYADLANRLPRGRAYLRNGSVLDLVLTAGRVEAFVAGSELYQVTIAITPLTKTRWRRVVARCTGRIGSLVGLLRGELSADVLSVLTEARDGLFPQPRELTRVGIRLDARPELFFLLRQVDQAELLTSVTAGAVLRHRPAAGKRIAEERLSAVFGIELEGAPPARVDRADRSSRRGPRPPSRAAARRRSSSSRRQ